jgi:hypothetical protein
MLTRLWCICIVTFYACGGQVESVSRADAGPPTYTLVSENACLKQTGQSCTLLVELPSPGFADDCTRVVGVAALSDAELREARTATHSLQGVFCRVPLKSTDCRTDGYTSGCLIANVNCEQSLAVSAALKSEVPGGQLWLRCE